MTLRPQRLSLTLHQLKIGALKLKTGLRKPTSGAVPQAAGLNSNNFHIESCGHGSIVALLLLSFAIINFYPHARNKIN